VEQALSVWARARVGLVEVVLDSLFVGIWPARLAEACAYPLSTGGKRIRPLWVFAAAEALGAEPSPALAGVAASLELIHTYSLVHDDLPCMDDDDERRGRPTVHVVYGEAPALLVGDALLTEAFGLLSRVDLPAARVVRLVGELAQGAGAAGMVGGQGGDIGMAGAVTDLETLARVHRGKTGALIRAAVRMGGLAAGGEGEPLERLTRYGEAIGLAFQMADDVLDAEQDAGGEGPPSYVQLLGVDETRRRTRILLEDALDAVALLPRPEGLVGLARYTVERDH
jgi:geranylgeranyl pyrophosphate synthase